MIKGSHFYDANNFPHRVCRTCKIGVEKGNGLKVANEENKRVRVFCVAFFLVRRENCVFVLFGLLYPHKMWKGQKFMLRYLTVSLVRRSSNN